MPRLINVRLDPERFDKARKLRSAGLTLSEVVREAIDAKFAALERSMSARDVAAAIASIIAQHPDPAGQSGRAYDVHDSRQARAAVRRALRRAR